MNCKQCQRRLLMCLDSESLPPELSAHLAGCLACRRWQKRLVQIESNVPLLPVPVSERQRQLQEEILRGPATLPMDSSPPRRKPRWRRIALGAGGLAAAVVLIAAGIFLGNMLTPNLNDDRLTKASKASAPLDGKEKTFAVRLLDLDLNLAEADTPRRRLETLARLAQTLYGESQTLAAVAGPEDLQTLAKLYGKVVQDGIVARARKLSPDERRHALNPIADQLDLVNRESEALAKKTRPETAAPLLQIAAVSRTGNQQLRALIEEKTQ